MPKLNNSSYSSVPFVNTDIDDGIKEYPEDSYFNSSSHSPYGFVFNYTDVDSCIDSDFVNGIEIPISTPMVFLNDVFTDLQRYCEYFPRSIRLNFAYSSDKLKKVFVSRLCKDNLLVSCDELQSSNFKLPDIFLPVVLWSLCFHSNSLSDDNMSPRDWDATKVESGIVNLLHRCGVVNLYNQYDFSKEFFLGCEERFVTMPVDAAAIYKIASLFSEISKYVNNVLERSTKEEVLSKTEWMNKLLCRAVTAVLRKDVSLTLGDECAARVSNFCDKYLFMHFICDVLFFDRPPFSAWNKFRIKNIKDKFYKLCCVLKNFKFKSTNFISKLPVYDIILNKKYAHYALNMLMLTGIVGIFCLSSIFNFIVFLCCFFFASVAYFITILMKKKKITLFDNLLILLMTCSLLLAVFFSSIYLYVPFFIFYACSMPFIILFSPLSKLLYSFRKWFYSDSGKSLSSMPNSVEQEEESKISVFDRWSSAEKRAESLLECSIPLKSWSMCRSAVSNDNVKSSMYLMSELIKCYPYSASDYGTSFDIDVMLSRVKSLKSILYLKEADMNIYKISSYLRRLMSRDSWDLNILFDLEDFQIKFLIHNTYLANYYQNKMQFINILAYDSMVFLYDRLQLICDYSLLALLTAKIDDFSSSVQEMDIDYDNNLLNELLHRVCAKIAYCERNFACASDAQLEHIITASTGFLDNILVNGNIDISIHFLQILNMLMQDVYVKRDLRTISSFSPWQMNYFRSLCSPVNNPNYEKIIKYIDQYIAIFDDNYSFNNVNYCADFLSCSNDSIMDYLPCILFAVVNCTLDALEESPLAQDLFNQYQFLQDMRCMVSIERMSEFIKLSQSASLSPPTLCLDQLESSKLDADLKLNFAGLPLS